MGKKLLYLAIVGCLLCGGITASAEEKNILEIPQTEVEVISTENDITTFASDPSMTACTVGIGIADNGLGITFDTTANQPATEIGVKNIVIKEKTLFGWKDITVDSYCTYNSDFYSGSIVYTGAVPGKTYYVKCTHYAKYGSNELSMNNTSSELTYN